MLHCNKEFWGKEADRGCLGCRRWIWVEPYWKVKERYFANKGKGKGKGKGKKGKGKGKKKNKGK